MNHLGDGMGVESAWVEGMLDYYHETGDPFVLDTALGVGQCEWVCYTEKNQRYGNARQLGSPLSIFSTLYRETWDDLWLGRAADVFAVIHESVKRTGSVMEGGFEYSPARVPFELAYTFNGLFRYHAICGDDEVMQVYMTILDDMINVTMGSFGLLGYKDSPSGGHPVVNPQVLEAPACAYRRTGDEYYLRAGLGTFWGFIQSPPGAMPALLLKDGHVIAGGPTYENSSHHYTLLSFCKAVCEAGLVQPDLLPLDSDA